MMKELKGRAFDVVRSSSGRILPGTFWTILTRSVPGISQFQIVQKRLDYIVVNLRTDNTFPKDSVPKLAEIVRNYMGVDTQVDINFVDYIEPGPSGKFRFVISEIKGK